MTLTREELPAVKIVADALSDGRKACDRSFLGFFFPYRELNFCNFKVAMMNAWCCRDFSVYRIRRNFYQFFIDDELRRRILVDGPWCFDDVLFVTKP